MSKSFAAYQLGYQTALCHHFIAHWGAMMSDFDGLRAGLDEIEGALPTLAAQMPGGVMAEIRQALAELRAAVDQELEAQRTASVNAVSFFFRLPFGGTESHNHILALTEDALKAVPRLYCWHQLGRSVGRYTLAVSAGQDEVAFPDIQPVIEAVRNLPDTTIKRIDFLDRLVQKAKGRLLKNPVQLLNKALYASARKAFATPNEQN